LGWWLNDAKETEKEFCQEYLNSDGANILPDLIKELYKSVATLAVIPIQDLLGQGIEARMNTPSVPEGNWQYIMPIEGVNDEKAAWLKKLVKIYGRIDKKDEKAG
jgi:4-alpha-glucanotransferase